MTQNDSRRDFLKKSGSLAAAATLPAPWLVLRADGATAGAGTHSLLQQVSTVPIDAVAMSGPLGDRHRKNLDYLLWRFQDLDRLMFPFEHRSEWIRIRDWDGEYAGKWLDAAALTAAATKDPALTDACHTLARRLRDSQESDGYLGTELPPNRLRPGWPLWMHWLAMKGLREHGQKFGDDASLKAAVRGGEWVVKSFAPITGRHSPFFLGDMTPDKLEELRQGIAEYLAKEYPGSTPLEPDDTPGKSGTLSITDELVQLYLVTGEARYLDFAAATVEHFPPMQKMRRTGTVSLQHAYSTLSYLGGAVMTAQARGDTAQITWIQRIWDDIAQNHLFPTASLSTGEFLVKRPEDVPNDKQQETCATVEWLMFTHRLYLATGNVRLANMLERTARNALLGAQSADGRAWTYYTAMRSRKDWLQGPTNCCFFSGPRGVARLPQLVYHLDGEGLRVDLFESGNARVTIQAIPVTVTQQTSYPVEGLVKLRVDPARPGEFSLKLRLPEYSENARVRINGKAVSARAVPGEYIALRRKWRAGDSVELEFQPRSWVSTLHDGTAVVMRGVEALSADRRDNPGSKSDFTEVKLPQRVELRLATPAAEGRPRYQALVELNGKAGSVLLTPYAEAGNSSPGMVAEETGYRTAFPQAGKGASG